VQALLRGETVEWKEEGTHKVRFLNPEKGYININDPIPAHISAFGPKGRDLVAKLGTGWLSGGGKPPQAAGALEAMKKSWTAAGRDVKDLYSTTFCAGAVLALGEAADSPRAKAQAGPTITMLFHDYAEHDELGAITKPLPFLKPLYDRYLEIYRNYQPADARYLTNHRGHLMFLRPEEEQLLSADLIRNMTMTGSQQELVEGVKAFKAAGFSQLAIHLRNGHEMEMLADWGKVIEKAG
jgi:5,10-methylenetetrahydromethanopterin reductase